MELIATWRTLYTLRYVPVTFVQVVFSAGTIFLLSALQATSGVRFARVSLQNSLSQAELCIQYLQEVGRSYQCAKNVAGILANLLQEQLKPKLAMRSQAPSRPLSPHAHSHQNVVSTTSITRVIEPFSQQSGPPPLHDTQTSNLYFAGIFTQASGQRIPAENDQQNIGWSTTSYSIIHADAMNTAPGPHFANPGFGSSPMGLGMKGGDTLSNRPFMPLGVPEPIQYDEAFYQRQLGLPQGHEINEQPQLTEEDYDTLQQYFQDHNMAFDG
jgi:hypothetical protein